MEGGGYMLLSRANIKVDLGRAIIVNGLVRFLPDDSHPGYDACRDAFNPGGRPSGYGGPIVVQYQRCRPLECRSK